ARPGDLHQPGVFYGNRLQNRSATFSRSVPLLAGSSHQRQLPDHRARPKLVLLASAVPSQKQLALWRASHAVERQLHGALNDDIERRDLLILKQRSASRNEQQSQQSLAA